MRSLAIINTTPNELCAELHDRMPVVLKPEGCPAWLGEEPAADVPLLKALLAPYPSEEMVAWPVSRSEQVAALLREAEVAVNHLSSRASAPTP